MVPMSLLTVKLSPRNRQTMIKVTKGYVEVNGTIFEASPPLMAFR